MKIVSSEPREIYFVFGPINRQNRWKFISSYEDFMRVLFSFEKRGLDEVVKTIAKTSAKFLSMKGIPVSESVIDVIFREKGAEDVFEFLMSHFTKIAEKKRPIFVIDELQKIKDVKVNGPLIYELFNFFIGLTKETHLCHVFCLTSDSLIIEEIYSKAMLQGRADYIFVDDFDYETTRAFLENYGFSHDEIETVWNHFGGKLSYLLKAVENRDELDEFCRTMLNIRTGQIKDFLYSKKKESEEVFRGIVNLLKKFESEESVSYEELSDEILACVNANVLFVNPVERSIKPQSRLDLLAIRNVLLRFP